MGAAITIDLDLVNDAKLTSNEKIETLFMIPSQEFSFLSSNLVKETARHGGNVSKLVPKIVFKELKKKFG